MFLAGAQVRGRSLALAWERTWEGHDFSGATMSRINTRLSPLRFALKTECNSPRETPIATRDELAAYAHALMEAGSTLNSHSKNRHKTWV